MGGFLGLCVLNEAIRLETTLKLERSTPRARDTIGESIDLYPSIDEGVNSRESNRWQKNSKHWFRVGEHGSIDLP